MIKKKKRKFQIGISKCCGPELVNLVEDVRVQSRRAAVALPDVLPNKRWKKRSKRKIKRKSTGSLSVQKLNSRRSPMSVTWNSSSRHVQCTK